MLTLVLFGNEPVEGVLDEPGQVGTAEAMPQQVAGLLELVFELLACGQLQLVAAGAEGLDNSRPHRRRRCAHGGGGARGCSRCLRLRGRAVVDGC